MRKAPWILMYHAVAPCDDDPHGVCISPERFERQMGWLSRCRLRGVAVRDLVRRDGFVDPRRLVGLTFDDGYVGLNDYVVPVLAEHGFTATVFPVAGRLGEVNDWDEGPQRRLLDARQLSELATAGVEVGSHGLTHTRLTGLESDAIATEVEESRTILEQVIGASPAGFCYPYGDFDDAALASVQGAGYLYGCAVDDRRPGSRFALPRSYVGERDSFLRLSAKLVLHRWGVRRGSRVV